MDMMNLAGGEVLNAEDVTKRQEVPIDAETLKKVIKVLDRVQLYISDSMEKVRVHACTKGNGIAEIWVMDTLHDANLHIFAALRGLDPKWVTRHIKRDARKRSPR